MTGTAAPALGDERRGQRPPAADRAPRPAGAPWPPVASSSLAAFVYLALAVAVWWHAWQVSPSRIMTCDCTDAGRTLWYLDWLPFALGGGHAVLHSTYLFHPAGINLLDDTSVPAVGLLLSPVTVVWGPVTAVNTASTLLPAATAFSMYWLLRRWVDWAPAAFVGGLAYGFSAWVVVQLSFGWLNLACVALLPLVAACLDELLARQRHGPVAVGAALALLLAVQFFVSIEMLLLVAIAVLVLLALVVAGGWLWGRDALRRRWRHAAGGLAVAGALAGLLLAYPVWFFLAGPSHLSGPVWSSNVPGAVGNVAANLWSSTGRWGPLSASQLAAEARALGGFTGAPWPAPAYLGAGFLAVLAAGLLLWRSDRRLWLLAGVGAVTFAFSLSAGGGQVAPWSLVDHLPVLQNVVEYRFAGIFVLCAAAMLGLVVDHVRSAVVGAYARSPGGGPVPRSAAPRAGAGLAAAAVAVAALVPVALALAPNLPVPMQPVTVPRWFSTSAPRLAPGAVLATYPFATADSQSSIPWQAIAGMPYEMAGAGGPAGTVARAGEDRAGFAVLRRASAPILPAPSLDRASLTAVREALRHWRVTMVVVPDDAGLKSFQTGRGTAYGVAFFTAVLGVRPHRQPGAWVWDDVRRITAVAGR